MASSGKKVLLAMSGGVDSSVAAVLLREQGYDVVGCFMRLGSPGETLDRLMPAEQAEAEACRLGHTSGDTPGEGRTIRLGKQGCCSVSDAADARLVAAQLGIPFYVCNFKKDFGRIMDYFAAEYRSGRTPNPCVRCNDWLKFGKLHEYARQIGADYVASGHYARVVPDASSPHGYAMLRGLDEDKDQSYVLFGVPPERLSHMLLPIGGLHKPQVRAIAEREGLPVFNKPDSQEICFVPGQDYAGFLERRDPGLSREGAVVDTSGRQIGRHQGQHRFTIGQRKGLGLALGYPVYVVGKDPQANTVTVGPAELLRSQGCVVGEANWLGTPPDDAGLPVMVQCNYNASPVPARIASLPPALGPTHSGRLGRFSVRFDQPQQAVTPGQALVVYGGEGFQTVLGGGWIESVDTAASASAAHSG